MENKPLEGDLIKSKANVIFDVKGLVHPPHKVIAFPRYVPDTSGDRRHGKTVYEKIYALAARFEFLKQNFPQYLVYDSVFDATLCEVPTEDVKTHYSPVKQLQELRRSKELDKLEACALEFFEKLKASAPISWGKIGISGSLLVRLHKPNSDIDPIIYGTENCRRAYEALKTEQKKGESLRRYTQEEFQKLYRFRFQDTKVSMADFLRTETRKVTQGKFNGCDYFLRFVRDWSEVEEDYGSVQYRNLGYARIRAEVEDDSEAIFTPCSYGIKNVKVIEGLDSHAVERIVSFRGRFCEQAKTDEIVVAQGKVEQVYGIKQHFDYLRLLIGNKPSDFMILA